VVAGLPCPLGPSDPVGLQVISLGSQISVAAAVRAEMPRLSHTAPANKEKLNRSVDIGRTGRLHPDI